MIPGLTSPDPQAGSHLLGTLRALAREHAVALPGGEEFVRAVPPDLPPGKALWQRLAYAIHADWIHGRFDAPEWAHRCLVQSLQLAWAGKAFDDAARQPLFAAWLQSNAALGDLAPLTGVLERHLDWLAQPSHAALALHAVRLAGRVGAWPSALPLLGLLAPRAGSDPAVADVVIHSALTIARQAGRPEDLRDVAQTLDVLLQPPVPRWRDDQLVRIGWTALRCLHLAALRRVVRELLGRSPLPSCEGFLGWALNALIRYEADDEVADLLARAAAALPGSALIQMERARLARERDADDAEVEALLAPLAPGAPGYRIAILWLANDMFRAGRSDIAERCFERAEAIAPLGPADRARLAHLKARGAAVVPAAFEPDDGFSLAAAGPLAGALMPLQRLMNSSLSHGAGGPDAAALRREGLAAVDGFAAALPQLANAMRLQALAALAHELQSAASLYFRDLARLPHAFPFALTAAYGSLDFSRCAAVCEVIHEHLLALVECVAALERPLADAAAHEGPRSWLDLVRSGCQSALLLGHGERALGLARQARRRFGEEGGGDLVRRIEEQCLLATERLDEARDLRRRMSRDADAEVVALRPWPGWVQRLAERPVESIADAAVEGSFEKVWPDGGLQAYAHQVTATSLWQVPVRGAFVSLSFGLEAPGRAGMLRPHPWHLMMGDYPYPHPDVLDRAEPAAVLRRRPARRIVEPVLVLANMDLLRHRNYYHWTLLVLTRAVWALEAHWLDGRRLLVPEEMPGWMWSGLADVGIGPDRLLAYGKGERLELADAQVLSPLEAANPTLLRCLRHRLWRAAGLDPAAPPRQDRLVHVTRRDTNRRPLVDEQALCQLAAELGFEVVAPEALTLLEQVRLFASARGVSGPPGAAFANLAWSQPGTRVLSIFKQEVTLPTFVDLSILLGQQHRWLLGRTVPGFKAMHPFNAPYSVDLGLARRELDWVRSAEAARRP